jgi:hypothetical protein
LDPKKIRKTHASGPEAKIQADVMDMLTLKGWYLKRVIGNEYQNGLPDIFACHSRYGQRWIEIKNPKSYKFTPAQIETFPKLCANGSGVWILIAATEEEYQKLFASPNWWQYTGVWT